MVFAKAAYMNLAQITNFVELLPAEEMPELA